MMLILTYPLMHAFQERNNHAEIHVDTGLHCWQQCGLVDRGKVRDGCRAGTEHCGLGGWDVCGVQVRP